MVELLLAISIMGILASMASATFNSMYGFYEQRRLRNAALEAMDMIREGRAKVMGNETGPPCIYLNPNDINQRMASEVTKLDVNPKTGGNAQVCFAPNGWPLAPDNTFLSEPMTLIISSPAVASQGDWCIVVTPLLAQTHLGWRPNGDETCRFDSAGGSL